MNLWKEDELWSEISKSLFLNFCILFNQPYKVADFSVYHKIFWKFPGLPMHIHRLNFYYYFIIYQAVDLAEQRGKCTSHTSSITRKCHVCMINSKWCPKYILFDSSLLENISSALKTTLSYDGDADFWKCWTVVGPSHVLVHWIMAHGKNAKSCSIPLNVDLSASFLYLPLPLTY